MEIATNKFINPLYVYIFSFILVFCIYSLKWSDVYPDLSWQLYLFFFGTFFISLIIAYPLRNTLSPEFTFVNVGRMPEVVLSIILISFLIEFVDFGGIPILMVFHNKGFSSIRPGTTTDTLQSLICGPGKKKKTK